jgi:pimeloyl-ACP methyl ester carboxylesterase
MAPNPPSLVLSRYNRITLGKQGRFGTRLILKDHKLAFHLIYNDTDIKDPKLPLVVFESHLGYASTCWGYLQKQLKGKLPTLAYQRSGYGWSKELEYKTKRTTEDIAFELRILLEELGIDGRPVIFVGHSYGGIVAQTYIQKYPSKANIGLVLLDSPPATYLDEYPSIFEFTCVRYIQLTIGCPRF